MKRGTMGLFGFGKKKHRDDDNEAETKAKEAAVEDDKTGETGENEAKDVENDAVNASDDKNSEAESSTESDAGSDEDVENRHKVPDEPSEAYPDRGELYGPWDIEEQKAPNYDEYLDMGAYYLPFMPDTKLRVKANRASGQVVGCTVSYKDSSLEIEALAAPKTLGLWDGVSEDLLAANPKANEQPGIFGTEIKLPVTVNGGKRLITRIVGVDGPRWMLRGIFSGRAATHPESPETKALNQYFSDIVVDRGEEPLAPRDLVPMHPPVSPEQRRKADEAAAKADKDGDGHKIPKRIKGPFVADQQTEVQTTISRGPMFSELR
ncbi:DUF3710 domain-containing protein [Bifidobacterium sp. ESL0745]|uniref:DUF3710 domain-containing protein n=1 Tax=Bifidobacterium sp. ESL0745 TaxID=2983226 RepID=UPI0023F66F97|nr:DUF3710 domain-containing protein [Bifidobacterium sp. ESL0745]MDF7664767.1 DUF3710 domain-containing protein [Bifidobacterium sp. ESL0745]